MTSLTRLSQSMPLEDRGVDYITSQPTAMGSNMAILDFAILFKGSNTELLDLCTMLETIIGDEKRVAQVVEPLRIGQYTVSLELHIICPY